MKKYLMIFAFFVLFSLSAWVYSSSRGEIEQADYKSVKAVKAEEEEFRDVFVSSGIVKGEDETKLSFEVPGRIEYLYKNNGDRIRKGEVLASIDSGVISAERGLAEEQLDSTGDVYKKPRIIMSN